MTQKWCRAIGFVSVVAALAVSQPRAAAQISWRSGAADPAPMEAEQILQSIASLSQTSSHGVAGFERAIDEGERAMLAEAGVHLLAPLGDHAYFMRVDARARGAAVIGAAPVAHLGPIALAWKLHPMLVRAFVPAWTVVEPGADPVVAVYVVYHQDVDVDGALMNVPAVGARVIDTMDSINGAVIELPYSQIADLAAHDDVQWIEPALPAFSTTNAENRAIAQVNTLQEAPYSLDGTGVTALVFDAGQANPGHQDFSGRLSILPGDNAGISDHSTHVAGTVGGDGTINFNNRGMAPNVTILSAGFQWSGNGIFLYENPGDIEQDYGVAIELGASVANNSIGTNTESNGFPCEIQGDYGVTSALIDAIARGSLGDPITIVWSNGNERGGSSCDIEGYGDFYSTAPPAGAKNHITIGALNANDDSMTGFSSWGPVDDGRMKPDICGPGCQSDGDFGVTSTSASGNYNVKCGTSMSAPTVTGIVALLLQDFRAQFPGRPDPLGSTVKAILAQTCEDLGNVGPDYQYGYGSVRAKDAIDFQRLGQFAEIPMFQGDLHSFDFEVEPGTTELRYSLAWADAPAAPNVEIALVNQLDLRLIDPNGGVHHPWVLDPHHPADPATQDGPNTRDNIEQVYVANPMPGAWAVQVIGTDVPEGPQIYSLVGSPGMEVTLLAIGLPSGHPELVAPGEPLEFGVSVTAINETVVPGSERLHYRFDGGDFVEVPLTPNGDSFIATIPGAPCGSEPEFFVSVEGEANGVAVSPPGGAADAYTYDIGAVELLHEVSFEDADGWVPESLGATTGDWQHGVPIDDPLWDYDPSADSDGSGQCFLTQNEAGNTDVDGGGVRVTSPAFDMSIGKVSIAYDYYLYLTNNVDEGDSLRVEINTGGATEEWTEIANHTVTGLSTWRPHVIDPNVLALAGVVPTEQTRLRFTANDGGEPSIVEAGIDHLVISAVVCASSCYADINRDGSLDILDFVMFQLTFAAGDPAADCDSSGKLDPMDFVCFQGAFAKGCP